ncbi:tRNA (guanine-N1)-methyltransferase [Aestuariivivens sediminicola]|uniref:tRNA (guanine-N1)-methyltransferase n=1 Tax=Aestuariivivens sediminicola TaxID=2913560 RepID=UPI001F577A25|nr:tRNA (guanine-N1)-methyltransferase [Aestuariivivens sediminicola]
MKPIANLPNLILLCLFSLLAYGQNTNDVQETELSLDSSTINDQFEYVLKKSGNFRGTNGQMYEAVKLSMLLTLKAHTVDSLKTFHKELSDTQAIVQNQTVEISNLKERLLTTQNDLDKTNAEKNSMALFGLQMSKTGYNVLMWSIIAGLMALLIFFIYKFRSSNTITRKAKLALSEIEDEFEEHRKTALEREQKVRRQLQDEINKQKGV